MRHMLQIYICFHIDIRTNYFINIEKLNVLQNFINDVSKC